MQFPCIIFRDSNQINKLGCFLFRDGKFNESEISYEKGSYICFGKNYDDVDSLLDSIQGDQEVLAFKTRLDESAVYTETKQAKKLLSPKLAKFMDQPFYTSSLTTQEAAQRTLRSCHHNFPDKAFCMIYRNSSQTNTLGCGIITREGKLILTSIKYNVAGHYEFSGQKFKTIESIYQFIKHYQPEVEAISNEEFEAAVGTPLVTSKEVAFVNVQEKADALYQALLEENTEDVKAIIESLYPSDLEKVLNQVVVSDKDGTEWTPFRLAVNYEKVDSEVLKTFIGKTRKEGFQKNLSRSLHWHPGALFL